MTTAASSSRAIFLDTSVILYLVLGELLRQHVQEPYALMTSWPRPLVSVISQTEAHALADAWNWGASKHHALDPAFRSLMIVTINHPAVMDVDVPLDCPARARLQGARRMGRNHLLTKGRTWAFLIPTPVHPPVVASA